MQQKRSDVAYGSAESRRPSGRCRASASARTTYREAVQAMQNKSTVSRRNLLGAAAAGAAAIGTSAVFASPAGASTGGHRPARVPRDKISVQLYTLRNQLAIDLAGTLAALAEIGY